jgi:hypothetical protein
MLKIHGRTIAIAALLLLVMHARMAAASGLGIPLDGFLTTLLTFITGLGLLMFTAGAASWGSVGPMGQ